MTHTTEQDRATFEGWARDRYPSIDLTRGGDDYSKALAKDYWSLWQSARRAPAAPVPQGWHAPGLGEVHNHDHTKMIYCADGDGVADDGIAQEVLAALAAAPQPPEADHIPDAGKKVAAPENIREGAPYDKPEFEQLARDLGVWGTAQAALCAQFWMAALPAMPGMDGDWLDSVERALSELPDFSHVATRKLQDLQERGYRVTGYAIEKPVEGGQPERGFITAGGFVGWWRGDDE